MTVYTVQGGQRKGSKHVINFPQNIVRLASVLPQLPDEIPLLVRRSNHQGTKHYDFRVRRGKVRNALIWLKANHKWYRDITISNDQLSRLPLDDNLEDLFSRGANEDVIEATNGPSQTVAEEGAPADETMGMS